MKTRQSQIRFAMEKESANTRREIVPQTKNEKRAKALVMRRNDLEKLHILEGLSQEKATDRRKRIEQEIANIEAKLA